MGIVVPFLAGKQCKKEQCINKTSNENITQNFTIIDNKVKIYLRKQRIIAYKTVSV